jgi:hypothetical protein
VTGFTEVEVCKQPDRQEKGGVLNKRYLSTIDIEGPEYPPK